MPTNENTETTAKENRLLRYARFGALFATVLITLALIWTNDEQKTGALLASNMEEPDAYLVNGVYREFKPSGELSSKMTTKQGLHFPESDEGVFSTPNILIYQEDRTPWVITSQQGQYLSKTEQLLFKGSVLIQQLDKDAPVLDFETDELSLFTKTKFIITDKPVKISSKAVTTTATGMKVWIDEKKVELLSNVEGIYVPQSN